MPSFHSHLGIKTILVTKDGKGGKIKYLTLVLLAIWFPTFLILYNFLKIVSFPKLLLRPIPIFIEVNVHLKKRSLLTFLQKDKRKLLNYKHYKIK